jgi:hypothetical protein
LGLVVTMLKGCVSKRRAAGIQTKQCWPVYAA